MGNKVNTCCVCKNNEPTNKRSKSSDTFIIQYSKEYAQNTSDGKTPESLDAYTRRMVFVSAMGLYQSWKQCPSAVLYAALLLMPLKKEWIYNPARYRHNITQFADIDMDANETLHFLDMLKWKDSQGLVCWMLDAYCSSIETKGIHPVWLYLNDILQKLYDPVTREKYKAIPLNVRFWESCLYVSEYDVSYMDIVSEMIAPSLTYKCIQEMLHQSNPNSLCSVVRYSDFVHNKSKWRISGDDWCISAEYDNYESY